MARQDDSLSSSLAIRDWPSAREPANKKDTKAWVLLLEPFFPPHLSLQPGKTKILPYETSQEIVHDIVERASKEAQIDLVSHISVELGRWDTAVWLGCAIIDNCNVPRRAWELPNTLTSLTWPLAESLDSFSRRRVAVDQISTEDLQDLRPQIETSPKSKPSLTALLSGLIHLGQDNLGRTTHAVLGALWVALGKMILHAASKDLAESSEILLSVAILLSKLHEKSFLPDTVYQRPLNADPTALQHSPIVADISNGILLKGVAEIPARNDSAKGETESLRSRIERHAPAQWLEYCLWCCVHGGWLAEGVNIVDRMRRINGNDRWRLMFWREMPKSITDHSVEDDFVPPNTEKSKSDGGRESAVTKTISTEVILALADGLAATVQGDRQRSGIKLGSVIEHLRILRRVLDRDRMSFGRATWEAYITRLVNSPGLQQVDNRPRLFEQILDMRKAYGDETNAKNALTHPPHQSTDDNFSTYICESSAAIIGLYHRILSADIRARDVSGALRTLAALQQLTDTNKQVSLEEFWAELRSTSVGENVENDTIHADGDTFPGVDYPGYFPSLPPGILAGLLDLLNESEAFDLGRWMISSSDIDGPLISESQYGDQIIAPALIRFAATTSDTELLNKVTRTQTSSISGDTLVALCESRIREANFDGAIDVFGLVRNYALHEWSAFDFCFILRAIVVKIYQTESTEISDRAYSLCQRLLRGDMGQVWGTAFTQVDTIAEILASFDEKMQELCSNLVPRGYLFKADLPIEAFNYLMGAAVKIWGSRKGQEVWQTWCVENYGRPLSFAQSEGEEGPRRPARQHLPSVARLFDAVPDDASTTTTAIDYHFHGSIKPTLPTIRIIIQQALEEYKKQLREEPSQERDPEAAVARAPVQHDILDWASSILSTFGLSEGDIDYELQGYLSAQRPDLLLTKSYSPETLRIWRAFTGPRRQWAQATEDGLRTFAETKADQQLIYEDQPSAERFLLLSLANDMGLHGETEGTGESRSIRILKGGRPRVPAQKIDEVLDSDD